MMMTREQFLRGIAAAVLSAGPMLAWQQSGTRRKRPSPTASSMPKLDAWSHVLPGGHLKRLNSILPGPQTQLLKILAYATGLVDLNARFRTMDRFGEYQQILTPVPALHLMIALTNPQLAAELIQASNDDMAELVTKHPDRFRGFAALLPLHNVEQALIELDRVAKSGVLGVQIETNINSVPLDDPRFEALFSRLVELNLAMWIHPFRSPLMPDYATEKTSRYGMSQALGWPYETAVCLSRLVFAGHLERHPKLRIIGHHGGGLIPHLSGRLGRYLEVWGPRIDPDLARALPALKKPLLDYFRMFYVDTALNGAAHAVDCVVDFFGADHVLFGTDTPFDPADGEFIRDTIADVNALRIPESARTQIFRGNAMTVLNLA